MRGLPGDKDVVYPGCSGRAPPRELPFVGVEGAEGVEQLQLVDHFAEDGGKGAGWGRGHFVQEWLINTVEVPSPDDRELGGIKQG